MSGCSSSLSNSPYLSGLAERFGAPDDHTADTAIGALGSASAEELSELKARFSLGWSHLALGQCRLFKDLGQLQSKFADQAIDVALQSAWQGEKLSGSPTGLFILGLGKLGGNDLNFSSDIDLIAYFDPDQAPISKAKGQSYVLDRVMKRMTRILMPPNDPDFVYRVDWRLRPEASVSGLTMSSHRAVDFYYFRALPWHRLALLKARTVAGDRDAGEHFLSELSPFLWRQNLDFRTIDELAALKSRINLEHPHLKRERQQRDPILSQPLGFNVKLGTGGIREIEFIVNAQQLIWGSKHYALRTTNTLDALTVLSSEGHLDATDVDALSDSYRDHRQLENALQMMRNGHEHVLPDTDKVWAQIAALMGQDRQALMDQATAHRHQVHERFTAMFEIEDAPDVAPQTTPFSEVSQAIVDDWTAGFRRQGVRTTRRGRLEPLGAALARRVAQAETPDLAVQRVDVFLNKLSRSEQYLSLLASNPALLDALIDPLLYSPHMSVLLEQSPHIIDTFLDPSPPSASFVLAETDYETRLERLRRFVNEGLFQTYHEFLTGRLDWRDLAGGLTELAEQAIETALTIARHDLGEPDLAIAVLGLGKLGQRLMLPQSDLDLIFLFDDGVDRDLATKAVRRLRTIITTPLREGIAYELDMRLRPSGRSGPPAVTLSAFKRHHLEAARSWEHIALVPARVVAGTPALGQQVEAVLTETLARPRDPEQLFSDAHYMWGKIADERIVDVPPDWFDTKLRRGGLMMADFWDAVAILTGAERLIDAREAWAELIYWERLLGLTGAPVESVPERYAARLPDALPNYQSALEARIISAVAQYPAPTLDETMVPIRWQA